MNIKKKIIKIIAVLLSVVIVCAGSFGGYILYRFNCNKSNAVHKYEEIYSFEPVKLNTGKSGIFKVLKINDTHFFDGKSENDKHTLSYIKTILDKTPCDLIVIDGDLVDGFNLKRNYDKFGAIDIFASLLEEYDTYWTFAPGNNDCEIDGKNEDIIAFMLQYEHFICGNKKDIDGSVQFFIDIYNGNKPVHSIAIMDSGTRKPLAYGPYQPIKENQAKWLNEEVNKRKVKTSVFFHMPTNAFQKAYDEGEDYIGIEKLMYFPYDDIENNYVFDNIIQDNEYISLISCGHQHSNNMCSFYNGRYYQLS